MSAPAVSDDTLASALRMVKRELTKLKRESKSVLPILLRQIRENVDEVRAFKDDLKVHKEFNVEDLRELSVTTSYLEVRVELLEEFDCGSTGGYGRDQPEDQDLLERAVWLLNKYDPPQASGRRPRGRQIQVRAEFSEEAGDTSVEADNGDDV